jgi:hypothetical protein
MQECVFEIRWYDKEEEESYCCGTVTMTEPEVDAYIDKLNKENGNSTTEYYAVGA